MDRDIQDSDTTASSLLLILSALSWSASPLYRTVADFAKGIPVPTLYIHDIHEYRDKPWPTHSKGVISLSVPGTRKPFPWFSVRAFSNKEYLPGYESTRN